MFQDDLKEKAQFCYNLGEVVYEILQNCKEFLSVIEELYDIYKPKTQEETSYFCQLKNKLPYTLDLLCSIQSIDLPDDNNFFDVISPLRDMALDTVTRMISIDVIYNDIINMHIYSYDRDEDIHLYLSILKHLSNSLYGKSIELENLLKEKGQIWPELLVMNYGFSVEDEYNEDESDEDESILPGENYNFQLLRSILVKALVEYCKNHKSENIDSFVLAIQDYLDKFAKGIKPNKEFDFSFVWANPTNDCEIEYVDLHLESEMIQVTSGGVAYNETVGSDSYTNWDCYIWLNGYEEDNQIYRFSDMLELVQSGAKLSILSPEEFIYKTEEE